MECLSCIFSRVWIELHLFKGPHKENSRFLNNFPTPYLHHELDWHDYLCIYLYINFHFMQNYSLQISVFLVILGQLVTSSDRELHLVTSNPSTWPLVDIVQVHFRKSSEALIKIGGCGWWLTLNIVSCQPCADECYHWLKISKLGLNEIGTFLQNFFSSSPYFWYPLNTDNGICISAFRSLNESTISLLFHNKMVWDLFGGLYLRNTSFRTYLQR